MESIADTLSRRARIDGDLSQTVEQLLANSEIQTFIAENQLSHDEVRRSYSKFFEYLKSKENQSYQPQLVLTEGLADVVYRETDQARAQKDVQTKRKRVQLIGLPIAFKNIRWRDVQLDDSKRVELYQRLSDFIASYPAEKGAYIYGDFGVGKSFMMAALAQEMAERGVSTLLVHYPSFIAEPNFGASQRVEAVKMAQILVVDDIGGEVNSNWARDNVLQVMLQYRMDNQLPTFFTSNYSQKDLEKRLAQTRDGVDSWAAKRVLERVKFLAKEIHLQGVNRRHG